MKNKRVREILILTAFTWMFVNMHHPVTPSLFTSLNLPDHVFGTSRGVMVMAMFFMSPVWGSLGDKGYRVEILQFVTFFYGVCQIIFGHVTSLWAIIVMRALSGVFASGLHVGLMSAIVDVSEKNERESSMASYSAIMSFSVAMGFLLGGFVGYLPVKMVFWIQGLGMIMISIFNRIFIKGTNQEERDKPHEKTKFIWDLVMDARKSEGVFTSWVKIFLAITFFVGIAYSSYDNAFNYYLKAELNMKPIVNGIWKSLNGIVGLVANLTINIWLINNTNLKKSIVLLLGASSLCGIMAYVSGTIPMFLIFNFLFATLYTLELPILQGLAIRDSVGDVGLMSGLYNASRSLGETLGASGAGFGYNISSKFPFLMGAIAVAIAFLLSILNRLSEKKLRN